jgi:imidazole glycerol-phosphate synthase subunit HisH
MIAVLDYGIGNLRSVLNAFEYIGVDAVATRDKDEICHSSGVVIPGVGAFNAAMDGIRRHRLDEVISQIVESGKPALGICVGFQMLMQSSMEMGMHSGFNFFSLAVKKIETKERLPHIGWANLSLSDNAKCRSVLLKGIEEAHFYFLHSYAVPAFQTEEFLNATSEYGGYKFISLVERGNTFGTQFHPEKSGESGLTLLKNFAKFANDI